jgi:ankyrin repeat protein
LAKYRPPPDDAKEQERHVKLVKLLIQKHGADVNWPNREGETPLHITAFRGSIRLVRLFLDSHADPNSLTK